MTIDLTKDTQQVTATEPVTYTRLPSSKESAPATSDGVASSYALALATSFGVPEEYDNIRQAFKIGGKSDLYDQNKGLWVEARSSANRKAIVTNTIQRALAAGVDPADALLGRGDAAAILTDETAKMQENTDSANFSTLADMLAHRYEMENKNHGDRSGTDRLYTKDSLYTVISTHRASVDQLVQQANDLFASEAGSEEGLQAKGWPEAVVGVIYDALPFVYTSRVVALGLSPLGSEAGIDTYRPGGIKQGFREYIAALPIEERWPFIQELSQTMLRGNLELSDWARVSLLQEIANGDLLQRGDTESFWDTVIDVGSALELMAIAKPVISAVRASGRATLGASRIASTQNSISPAVTQNTLAKILAGKIEAGDLEAINVTQLDVAQSQLPGPGGLDEKIIDDIPNVTGEAERLRLVGEQVDAATAMLQRNVYRPEDTANAVVRVANKVREAWGGQARPSMSTIAIKEDGTGFDFTVMLGKNDTHGFGSTRTAYEQVEDLVKSGIDPKLIQVHTGDGLVVRNLRDGNSAIEELSAIRAKTRPSERGRLFVSYKSEQYVTPQDRGLFGSTVLTGAWDAGLSRYLTTPSASIAKEIYHRFLLGVNTEQSLVASLDALVAPYHKLPNKAKRNVDRMYHATHKFGLDNKRLPTPEEMGVMFPNATSNEKHGYVLMKQFYDKVYEINNLRLYRDMKSRGAITLQSTSSPTTFHGTAIEKDGLSSLYSDSYLTVYDPQKKTTVRLSSAQVKSLYEDRRGTILKLQDEITIEGTSGPNSYASLVLHDPLNEGFKLGPLTSNPLEYIPGYWPRMYKDQYVIEKVVRGAVVDGKAQDEYTMVVAMADTEKEANRFINRMNGGEDYVEGAIETDPNTVWRYRAHADLDTKDKTAADMQQLRTENRIWFSARDDKPLPSTRGGDAATIDPSNMLDTTTRALSRDVAMTDLIAGMKHSFQETFSELVGDVANVRASVITARLDEFLRSGTNEQIAQAKKAKVLWNYINTMDGDVNQASKIFRSTARTAAEWLHESLSGIPSASRATTYLLNEAAPNFNPLQTMKNLAFIDFIVTRPVRQLLLQSSQHFFLQALDPGYAGKWQLESTLLLQGAKRRGATLIGGKDLSKDMIKRNAHVMGVTDEEYVTLVEKFGQSGLVQAVNIHSFAGDVSAVRTLPATELGDALTTAGRTVTAAPIRAILQKYGFDLGEQYNVSASYMMAQRMYRKEKGIGSLSEMVDADWDAVAAKASDYAFAMNRANSALFQYGYGSMMTQFFQFQHKTLLTMMRAGVPIPGASGIPGIKKLDLAMSNLGNKAFTREEARKMLSVQVLLFGGAAFGAKETVDGLLAESGLGEFAGTEISNLISGGLVDSVINGSLQAVLDDPEFGIAASSTLAPTGGIIHTARTMAEIGFDDSLAKNMLGASGDTASGLLEAFQLARLTLSLDTESLSNLKKSQYILEYSLAGATSGYSDFMKARWAMNMGQWASSDWEMLPVKAKFSEAVAKGLFGVNPKDLNTYYHNTTSMRETLASVREATEEYHLRASKIATDLLGGGVSKDKYLLMIEAERVLFMSALTNEERLYASEQWAILEQKAKSENRDMAYLYAQYAAKNGPPNVKVLNDILSDPKVPDIQKQALIAIQNNLYKDIELATPLLLESLDQQKDLIERMHTE